MAEDNGNGTGSNAVWAIAFVIVVAIIGGVVYYSGVLKGGPADQGGLDTPGSLARRERGGRQRRDRPALGDRHEQRAPHSVAVAGRAQRTAGEGEGVSLRGPVVQLQPRDRKEVRRTRVEDERVLQFDRPNDPALGAEPARGGQPVSIELREGPGDLGPGRSRRGAQILSITCLTTV